MSRAAKNGGREGFTCASASGTAIVQGTATEDHTTRVGRQIEGSKAIDSQSSRTERVATRAGTGPSGHGQGARARFGESTEESATGGGKHTAIPNRVTCCIERERASGDTITDRDVAIDRGDSIQ